MSANETKHANFMGITYLDYYGNGNIKECTLNKAVEIHTGYGVLIPQYKDDEARRKFTKSLSFYKNGNLKSIALHEQTMIRTSIGSFPAELITFHENGSINRLFPLNGKISGYWTEENEYELAEEFEFSFSFTAFRKKVIALKFYESGELEGLTFWPKDTVTVKSGYGELETRIGLGLYPDGSLKSIEPASPVVLDTPIGGIAAYNSNAIGIHSDSNSLVFNRDGSLKALAACTDVITVEGAGGRINTYTFGMTPNMFNPVKMDIVPLQIEFHDGQVCFNYSEKNIFDIKKHSFNIRHFPRVLEGGCSDCSSCNACG